MERIREDVAKVLNQYEIEVTGIKTESYKDKKGVWWVGTPDGYRILKKHSNSKETVEFIIAAVEYLKNRGVNIPDILKNREGNNYVYLDQHCYMLSKAIIGKNPSYSSSSELKRIVQGLADFHAASAGIIPPEGCKPRIHLGNWVENYLAGESKLIGFYREENTKKEHDAFGTVILKEFTYFLTRIEDAIRELEKSCYHQWSNEVSRTNCLCHQDFAAGNLLLTETGDLFVLDNDSITIDIPIRDIRKILNKVMKKLGGWDAGMMKTMLEWYQQRNPLDASKWKVLKADLTYPYLFEGIMRKYYEKREKTWTQDKYLNHLKEMIKIEKSLEPVLESFDTLIPV